MKPNWIGKSGKFCRFVYIQQLEDSASMKEQLASVQIVPLTGIYMPDEGPASACIVQFARKRILLTVFHAAGDGRNWAVPVRFVTERRAVEQYPLGKMNPLMACQFSEQRVESELVDFAYVAIPDTLQPMDEVLDRQGNVRASRPKQILPPSFVEPNTEDTYGFFGLTRDRLDDEFNWLLKPKLEIGLTYVGNTEDLLRFRCKERYHEYEEYKGCSGAPILNQNGELVSLVVEGSDDRWEIRGLDLRRCWPALLIEADEFTS
jgi:hypothetical protein